MHLIVPFAAPLSEAGRHALQTLRLPHLDALLARCDDGRRDDGDEHSFTPPHERALARALGFAGADGELPWAAWMAQHDGVDTDDLAWGLLTPSHWEVGADHVRLDDPAALKLSDAVSRAFFDAVHPLFQSEGVLLVYGAPLRWYVAHESLAHLPTASLDRAIGSHVETWLPTAREGRLMRRLQNEAQMLLYNHPLNLEREARGELAVNSFWLSGCGLPQPVRADAEPPLLDHRLRRAALAEDWAAWTDAWRALDAELGVRLRDTAATLVLCGQRHAVRFDTRPPSLWQRVRATLHTRSSTAVLESL